MKIQLDETITLTAGGGEIEMNLRNNLDWGWHSYLTPTQARKLARKLNKLADKIDPPKPTYTSTDAYFEALDGKLGQSPPRFIHLSEAQRREWASKGFPR